MGIVQLGLLLFAFLQNLLQRILEMVHRQAREKDQLQNPSDDHLCNLMKKVRFFALMDEQMLKNFCVRLKPKFYVKDSKIITCGDVIHQIIFIARGKLAGGSRFRDSEGDACGKELIPWCLDPPSSLDRVWAKPGVGCLSARTVTCLTNVEAFSLDASDLEQVLHLFPSFMTSPDVHMVIRYYSPYWIRWSSCHIEDAWNRHKRRVYWKRCLERCVQYELNMQERRVCGKHTLAVKNEYSSRCIGQEYKEP